MNRQQGWDRTDPAGVLADIVEMSGRSPGEPGGWVQFTVEERETGRIVGDVGFAVADGEPNVIKVGYTISPGFQGRGYATEAIRALVDYSFDTLGAEIVRAHASAENAPRSASPRRSGCGSSNASSTARATRSGTGCGTRSAAEARTTVRTRRRRVP